MCVFFISAGFVAATMVVKSVWQLSKSSLGFGFPSKIVVVGRERRREEREKKKQAKAEKSWKTATTHHWPGILRHFTVDQMENAVRTFSVRTYEQLAARVVLWTSCC